MAEYEERSLDDLTEEPTAHRLEELREKGQVAQSRELTSTVVFIGMLIVLYFTASRFLNDFSAVLKEALTTYTQTPLQIDSSQGDSWKAFVAYGGRCLHILMTTFFPIALVGTVLGILASVGQVGFIFTIETLSPDLQRVNPISGFTKIFSTKSLVEIGKAVLKICIVSAVTYYVIRGELNFLPSLVSLTKIQILNYCVKILSKTFFVVTVLLLGTSLLDYYIQWMRFRKQSMMTKAEAKQELKEREGDPQIRARIKSVQREAARKRMMKSVPKADVVITNPTHFAIALKYDPDEGIAPKVVAKGADFLAEKIKKVAREHGIPTVENKPLARTLYKHVKVGQMIPRSLYQAVAEILAYVYKLKGKNKVSQKDSRMESGRPTSPSI